MATYRNDGLETIEGKKRPASTVVEANTWLQSDNAGGFIPLTPTAPIVGLCLETVDATDPNFATAGLVHVDLVTETTDRFLMDVATGGVASQGMVGLAFDVDAADAGSLDVSGAGTQFEITRVITTDRVEVRPLICCEVGQS